ncbi:MAG: thioredoxin family protein [Alphaproteobacteria bacterium]|nr:MAG: thioredoxin family protein [Alphaproteobacteria bacterium]
MAEQTPVCDFGWKAPDFALPDLDGRIWRLSDVAGPRGTLVMFLCNHCPFVRAIEDRIARDARDLAALGIGVAAICSNDAAEYPEDGPEGLRAQVRRAGFDFPYLIDEDQSVARAWGAACTPDFFGLNARGELQYRGRLDASGRNPAPPDARRELYEAMRQIAETGEGPREQVPSIGCSIKWKAA